MPKVEQTVPKILTKLGEGLTVFTAPSTSRPGTSHFVVVFPDERGITCTCEGWRYNRHCWHTDEVPLCMKPIPKDAPLPVKKEGKMFTFNILDIAECHFVEGHQGGHSWES